MTMLWSFSRAVFAVAAMTTALSSHAGLEARFLNADAVPDAYYDTALDIT